MIFLSEALKDGEQGPSCNVCGAIMTREPMPKRIQRKRAKAWKMPPNTVYVGRPTGWGNPWGHGADRGRLAHQCATRAEAVLAFRSWITEGKPELSREAKKELRGKDLACWCPLNQPCHADVLLEIVNQNRPWNCLSCGASTGVR